MNKKERQFHKFPERTRKRYLLFIATGRTRETAAAASGISYRLVHQYCKRYPTFIRRMRDAECKAVANVEGVLYKASMAGDVRAMTLYLYNRHRKLWKDRRHYENRSSVQVKLPNLRDLARQIMQDRNYIEYQRQQEVPVRVIESSGNGNGKPDA